MAFRTRHTALAVLFVALAAWLFVAKASRRMPDFEVYWRAGVRAAAAEPLYQASDADYQFKYFPAFAVLAVPFGLLPLSTAKVVWFTLSALSFAALLQVSIVLLPARRKTVPILIAALLLALGKYYAEDLVLGQVNIIVTLTVGCALLLLAAGREASGGALVALAVALKPYALILVPWIAARRKRASITTVIAGLAVACASPVVFYGIEGTIALHRNWWQTVSATTEGILLHSDNVSLASLWAKRLGIGRTASQLAAVSSVLLLSAAALTFVRRGAIRRPDGLEAGLLLAMTPLLSPQGWDYVLVLATIAMVFVINDIDRLPYAFRLLSVTAFAVVGLSLYDLVGRRIIYALLNWSVITIAMLVIIAAVVTLRVRNVA